jgi:hypothetical protein
MPQKEEKPEQMQKGDEGAEERIRKEYESGGLRLFVIAVGGGGGTIVSHGLLEAIKKNRQTTMNYLFDLAIGNRYLFVNAGPELRTYQGSYPSEHLIDIGRGQGSGSPSAGRRYYQASKQKILDTIKKLATTDTQRPIDFFVVVNTCGGGTGTSVGPLIVEDLAEHYPESIIINFIIFPEEERGMGAYTVPYAISEYTRILEGRKTPPWESKNQKDANQRNTNQRNTSILPIVLSNRHCINALTKKKAKIYSPEEINPLILRCIFILLGILVRMCLPWSEAFADIRKKIQASGEGAEDRITERPFDQKTLQMVGGSFIVPIIVEGAPEGIEKPGELSSRVFQKIKKEGFWISESEGRQRYIGSFATIPEPWTGGKILAAVCGSQNFANENMKSHLHDCLKVEFTNPTYLDVVIIRDETIFEENTIFILVGETYFDDPDFWLENLKENLKRKRDHRIITDISQFTIQQLQSIYEDADERISERRREYNDLVRQKKAEKMKKKPESQKEGSSPS